MKTLHVQTGDFYSPSNSILQGSSSYITQFRYCRVLNSPAGIFYCEKAMLAIPRGKNVIETWLQHNRVPYITRLLDDQVSKQGHSPIQFGNMDILLFFLLNEVKSPFSPTYLSHARIITKKAIIFVFLTLFFPNQIRYFFSLLFIYPHFYSLIWICFPHLILGMSYFSFTFKLKVWFCFCVSD